MPGNRVRGVQTRRSGAASSHESITVSNPASMSATGASPPFGAVTNPLASVTCAVQIRSGRAPRSRAAPWERHADAEKNAVASREAHPGLLPYPVGCCGFAVRYPQGNIKDAQHGGPGGDGGAERLDLGPGGRVLHQAAQDVQGPAGDPDGLDDHAVADRAQPRTLAGQQLGGAGRADALDRRQRVPQDIDAP